MYIDKTTREIESLKKELIGKSEVENKKYKLLLDTFLANLKEKNSTISQIQYDLLPQFSTNLHSKPDDPSKLNKSDFKQYEYAVLKQMKRNMKKGENKFKNTI